jgi:hypothetical protein
MPHLKRAAVKRLLLSCLADCFTSAEADGFQEHEKAMDAEKLVFVVDGVRLIVMATASRADNRAAGKGGGDGGRR